MSASNAQQESNNPYDWIERASQELWTASQQAVGQNEASLISDEAVARIMTAAVKLYVAKTDGEERTFSPVVGPKDEHVTATEILTAVAELLRALRLGPMELALWYRRRPDEE